MGASRIAGIWAAGLALTATACATSSTLPQIGAAASTPAEVQALTDAWIRAGADANRCGVDPAGRAAIAEAFGSEFVRLREAGPVEGGHSSAASAMAESLVDQLLGGPRPAPSASRCREIRRWASSLPRAANR